jgi:hypothetical protein
VYSKVESKRRTRIKKKTTEEKLINRRKELIKVEKVNSRSQLKLKGARLIVYRQDYNQESKLKL